MQHSNLTNVPNHLACGQMRGFVQVTAPTKKAPNSPMQSSLLVQHSMQWCTTFVMDHLPSTVPRPDEALQWRWLGIVHQQQKVVTSAGLHHAMQEPFAHTEVRCLHSVTQDALLFEQVVLQNSVFAR